MSTGGIVLKKVLEENSLEGWTSLKQEYFSADLRGVFRVISRFVSKHDRLPSFAELDLVCRDTRTKNLLILVENQEIPEVELDLAIEALVNEFIQDKALTEIDSLVDNITVLDAEEIIDGFQGIVMDLEELVVTNSEIHTLSTLEIFEEERGLSFITLNLNNTMDAKVTGAARGEFWIVGGYRGTGKSVTCSNIQVNEYKNGYIAPYFSIEMKGEGVMRRNIAILAEIDALRLRNGTSTKEEQFRAAKVMSEMYENGEEVYADFCGHEDIYKFEKTLKTLKEKDSTLPVIHKPGLSVAELDIYIQKFKARYGDKFRTCIVDYVNQLTLPGVASNDRYDWKVQTHLSRICKELAEKYDIFMMSPYQIHDTGQERFSKGLLDAVDAAIILRADKSEDNPNISFKSTKVRDLPAFEVRSKMNWDTLRIDPTDAPKSVETDEEEEPIKHNNSAEKEGDLPWDTQ